MKLNPLQFIFLFALIFSMILTPWFAWLARRLGIMDHPVHRKTHSAPMAYLGGVSIFCAFLAAFGLSLSVLDMGDYHSRHGFMEALLILGVSLGVAGIGLLDDAKSPSTRYKFAGQAVFALAFTFFGFQFQVLHFPGFHPMSLGLLSVPVTVFWILAVVNAFNMIDGLDG
ncbi:MAG: glycosyltransferase family 4 protein, partial [bacterium]